MECFLMCCNSSHEAILLPDGQPLVLGRGPVTKISDKKCSRRQVDLTACYTKKEVRIKQIGNNSCSVEDVKLAQQESAILRPGQTFFFLHNQYPHYIQFTKSTKVTSSVTPKVDELDHSEPKPKKARYGEMSDSDSDTDITPKKDDAGKLEANENMTESNKLNDSNNDPVDEDVTEMQETLKGKMCQQVKELFTVGSQDCGDSSKKLAASGGKWEEIPDELLVFTSKGVIAKSKIASFDLDWTIIATKSGKVFPVSTNDWRLLLPQIPKKLKELCNAEYKIVIFSNQSAKVQLENRDKWTENKKNRQIYISKKRISVPDFKKKVEDIVAELNVPVQVFLSPGPGVYRKPLTGMWKHLVNKANESVTINTEESFYVGDAAGRPVKWKLGKKKDFSCVDRALAANVGLKFYTPEEYFVSEKPAPFDWPKFDPRQLNASQSLSEPAHASLTSDCQELIVLVGYPASGKTSFAKEHLLSRGYVHINRDILGTWQKCVTACKNALLKGSSVVVDNTSPNKESRKRYVDCAKQVNVPVRCYLMNVTKEHAQHNNRVRELTNIDPKHKHVGHMVFSSYSSSFEEPTCTEGFKEILKINFLPRFKEPWIQQVYMQFINA